MRSTGAAITEVIEAYGNRAGQWISITEIAERTGLTRDELTAAITELTEADDFYAEPEAHRHCLTDRDREIAPIIAGEPVHKICFER